jgi:uncharacterized spore protein YtfJ
MSEHLKTITAAAAENHQEMMHMLEKLYTAASPDAVFSEPVVLEDKVVITASEVNVGLGVGYGLGGGPQQTEQDEQAGEADAGMGGGGGGGGGASGRPVAVITVSDQGVRVEPILDGTKIALAFFTALGSMFLMFSKMKKK